MWGIVGRGRAVVEGGPLGSVVRWSRASAPVGSVVQVVGSGSGPSRACQVVALARLRRGRAVVLGSVGSVGSVVLVVLVDSRGSAGRRGRAVSRAAAAPLVVRLGVVRSCSAPAPSSPAPSYWSRSCGRAQFLHAIGALNVVEGVSGQTVKGFTYDVLCT
jgi:hypothetical protein